METHVAEEMEVVGDRFFWAVFWAAWVAYLGLFVSVEILLGDGAPMETLRVGLLNAAPPAAARVWRMRRGQTTSKKTRRPCDSPAPPRGLNEK